MSKLAIRIVDTLAKQYDAQLKATDPRFRNSVMVIHEEGTVLYFESAFSVKVENWYVIFTEHHRFHVYDDSDVEVFMRGPRIEIPKDSLMQERETLTPLPPKKEDEE